MVEEGSAGTPVTSAGTGRSHSAEVALGVRLLGPYLLYALLGSRIHNDLVALAVAAAVPLVIGIITSLRARRLDWAAALSFASLAASIGIARLFGLGTTAVKLRGAVDPAVLGIILLVVAALPRRRLIALARAAAGYARARRAARGRAPRPAPPPGSAPSPGPAPSAEPTPSPGARRVRNLRILAVLWGGGLLIDAAAHVLIVFAVSTSAYLVVSKLVRWAIVLVLIATSRALRRRWKSPATARAAAGSRSGSEPSAVS
jgi:hypothetical protein